MITLTLSERTQDRHIEAPGCIINIRTGLRDIDGRAVTSIEVLADADLYSGNPEWWIIDGALGLKHASNNIRVVCQDCP